MKYEVELKFRLPDLTAAETLLRELGAAEHATVHQVDRYFNHPSRDFRATDEAFRIRSTDSANRITYKGAVIGNVAKTRQEIEVAFADGLEASQRFVEIMTMLGFRFIREVQKTRRPLSLNCRGRAYDIAIDHVPPLGHFLEIELAASDLDREQAEIAVWDLATQLGLSGAEPRSYLKLLLESDGIPC